jgi:hypothetical protein
MAQEDIAFPFALLKNKRRSVYPKMHGCVDMWKLTLELVSSCMVQGYIQIDLNSTLYLYPI